MATDYEGNTCGEAGRGTLGYYPRLSEDVIVAMQARRGPAGLLFYTAVVQLYIRDTLYKGMEWPAGK